MAAFANEGNMIPEQVWDREDPTGYGWRFGEGTGSATPLSWSMAQFIRLAWGIDAGEPVETPRPSLAVPVDVSFSPTPSSPGRRDGRPSSEPVAATDADGRFETTVGLATGHVAATDAITVDDRRTTDGEQLTGDSVPRRRRELTGDSVPLHR